MKYSLLFAVLITYNLAVFCQIDKKRIIKGDSLKYKSVQLQFPVEGIKLPEPPLNIFTTAIIGNLRGSGFFIKYKKDYFLLTNYHLITGRMWEDTTLFANSNIRSELDKMTVTFYSNNQNGYENINFDLHDEKGNRTYLSLPVNEETKMVSLDIALLKIDSLIGNTTITPFDLSNYREKWVISHSTELFSYGYSKRTWDDLYPFCDTIFSVGDTVFSNKDKYIFVYNPPNMHGSSGSPVYFKKKGKYRLVGIFFAQIPSEIAYLYPEIFFRTTYMNPVGIIITISHLKKFLDLILNKSTLAVSKSP